jgi:hypothetical protein
MKAPLDDVSLLNARAPPSKRKTTPKLKARSDGRVGLHTAESRARHRWVAAEALTLLLERYATHLARGCTSSRCVDNSITRVCADSLTCPVCTLTSPTAKPISSKIFFTADLAPFFTSIAQQHGKLDVDSWKVMLRLPRVDPSIESFTPRLHYAPYPIAASRRCWAVASWQNLILELPHIGPHVQYRVLAAANRVQRHLENTGSTFKQASTVLGRLCRDAGVPYAADQFTTTFQLIQYARLHNLNSFEPELDRVKYRVALAMEKAQS